MIEKVISDEGLTIDGRYDRFGSANTFVGKGRAGHWGGRHILCILSPADVGESKSSFSPT